MIQRIKHEAFPSLLQKVDRKHGAPQHLYIRGSLGALTPEAREHRFLCIVGPRKYSEYGKEVCKQLISDLAGFPVTIVSGLAYGIDALAHTYAIENRLTTIAVLGGGLDDDTLYPRAHTELAYSIIEAGGALISEHPTGYHPLPHDFPLRNRIMAGMSHAVLVIEAMERSGTLITAKAALDHSRDVYAVPGSIFSPSSAGTHRLIQEGARCIHSSNDLLDALGFIKFLDEKNKNGAMQLLSPTLFTQLSQEERLLYDLLALPLSRDELIQQTTLSPALTLTLLSKMEIAGIIRERLGRFERCM